MIQIGWQHFGWNILQRGNDLLKSFEEFLASIASIDKFMDELQKTSRLEYPDDLEEWLVQARSVYGQYKKLQKTL